METRLLASGSDGAVLLADRPRATYVTYARTSMTVASVWKSAKEMW